jgi:hypothetical protein
VDESFWHFADIDAQQAPSKYILPGQPVRLRRAGNKPNADQNICKEIPPEPAMTSNYVSLGRIE